MRNFYITNCSLEQEQAFRQCHRLEAADIVLSLLTAKLLEWHSEEEMEKSVCTTFLPQQHFTLHHAPNPVFPSKASKKIIAVVFPDLYGSSSASG